jgi:hypothetical protein
MCAVGASAHDQQTPSPDTISADANAASTTPSCNPQWHLSIGMPGLSSYAKAATVFNGDLIVAGDFIYAGKVVVNRIARWDGTTWHPLASGGQIGVNGVVWALAVYNGDLYAGGEFTTAGGQPANRIARWDGSEWHPILFNDHNGVSGWYVFSFLIREGELVVGGWFTAIAGDPAYCVARWDGASWHPFFAGDWPGVNGPVYALAEYEGDLVLGGWFNHAGGQPMNNITRWNGSEWLPFTAGGQTGVSGGSSTVFALAVYNGDLIAAGSFLSAGGTTVTNIARWNGASWRPLTVGGQTGVNATVRCARVYNNELIVGGDFNQAGGQPALFITRWNGVAWLPFLSSGPSGVGGNFPTRVDGLTEYNDRLVAVGSFVTAGGEAARRVAEWTCVADGCAPADLNCDGSVDVFDLLILLGAWGPCPGTAGDCPADLNGDGAVDVFDLLVLLGAWA